MFQFVRHRTSHGHKLASQSITADVRRVSVGDLRLQSLTPLHKFHISLLGLCCVLAVPQTPLDLFRGKLSTESSWTLSFEATAPVKHTYGRSKQCISLSHKHADKQALKAWLPGAFRLAKGQFWVRKRVWIGKYKLGVGSCECDGGVLPAGPRVSHL